MVDDPTDHAGSRGFLLRDHVGKVVLGSPVFAGAAAVGVGTTCAWLKERGLRVPGEEAVLLAVLLGNAGVAAVGSAVGGWLMGGTVAQRSALAIVTAGFGLLFYFLAVLTLTLVAHFVTGLEVFVFARR